MEKGVKGQCEKKMWVPCATDRRADEGQVGAAQLREQMRAIQRPCVTNGCINQGESR
jgi:hypothetical protein